MNQTERRDKILLYVKEKGPCRPKDISKDLGIPYGTLSMDTKVLRATGKLKWHLGFYGLLEYVKEKESLK